MRLEDNFRNTVVFIGTGKPGHIDEIDPWGSAFLIDVNGVGAKYLVTAHHVVADKMDAPFDIRFNKRGGGAENHHIDDPHTPD